MLKIINVQKNSLPSIRGSHLRPDLSTVEKTVAKILYRVQRQGDEALRYFTKKYDGAKIQSIAVPSGEIKAARDAADPRFIRILTTAAANIKRFHRAQHRSPFSLSERHGSRLQQIFRPIEKAGVYIPGGKAAYPSTVLMNVIPALVAGVKEIHLVSPPDRDGNIHPDVLTAASILGISRIYRVGGAQAVAALAYGTKTIPAVDKIVGPGNIFVASAKRQVFGIVGIDSFAGPSEVVILADHTADPSFVAADLLAQAEHDERAVAVLVTTSRFLAEKVNTELSRLSSRLSRKAIIATSLRDNGKIIIVPTLGRGISIVNALAPEHLQIITAKDAYVLKRITHAGSIFLGNNTPVAVGDYFAGPNHVLPTGRTARFSSPLSVDDFMKKSSVVKYSALRMQSVAEEIAYFAEREGLTAHALSVRLRNRSVRPKRAR